MGKSRDINPGRVFRLVLVEDGVALVVVALADQPAKDAGRVVGVGGGDPGPGTTAVECCDVVLGDRTPVNQPRGALGPALDAGKQGFDARPVAIDTVSWRPHGRGEWLPLPS